MKENSEKVTNKKLKGSVLLIVILGILITVTMFGFASSRENTDLESGKKVSANIAKIEKGVQTITINLKANQYEPITVQKGIPVRFNIKATKETINGCNGKLIIPEFNIEKTLVPGDNIIEFTPTKEGTIEYTCWMGMLRSTIQVVPDLKKAKTSTVPVLKSTMSGGSCCGAMRKQ